MTIEDSIRKLKDSITKIVSEFLTNAPKEVVLLHHNDTDGLSTGTILFKAFERESYKVHRFALEKPYPEIVAKIFSGELISDNGLIVFADFGSGMIETIKEINQNRFRVLILDHHAISGSESSSVRIINPLQFGIREAHCSASALSFIFSLALNSWNIDLAALGALGALGDGFLIDGDLQGVNQLAAMEARKQGEISSTGFIYLYGGNFDYKELCKAVDCLGSIAYFKGGSDIAIKALSEKSFDALTILAKPYLEEMSARFKFVMETQTLNESLNINWFDLKDSFNEYGVKTVGLLCQKFRDSTRFTDQDTSKYIAGFQHVSSIIPGVGELKEKISKVSMRVPSFLVTQIENGTRPGLTEILPQATRKVGGFVDACHRLAAATTIPIGREEDLIVEMEKIIASYKK
ncbi:MAG: hypothetical protein SGJ02_11320 [bacterium]|nr:hypothetical protein [bacterium]